MEAQYAMRFGVSAAVRFLSLATRLPPITFAAQSI
jgi:hypothetical protein